MTDIESKKPFENFFSYIKKSTKPILPEIFAIILAFLVGAVVLLITGYSPFIAYSSLLSGAFGDKFGIGQTLTQATPIIFTGLAFAFAFRSGIFNIGIEGQFLIGAFAAALAGTYIKGLPFFIHVPLSLFSGGIAGAIWAYIPAIIKVKRKVHEVITTMMLSYVALFLTSYMVNYPFKAPGWVAQTIPIEESAKLPRILPPTQLSFSFFIAIIFVLIVFYLLYKAVLGYETRAVGLNLFAASSSGINIGKRILMAFLISGFIAGVGGAGEILGVHRRFVDGFSPGYGWDGIAVALVGKLNPVGIFFSGILFGALRAGGMTMTRVSRVPLDLASILQSLVILFIAAPYFIKFILKKWRIKL